VVLVLALVVFGPKKLPEVGRQVGGALRELRKVQDTVQSEIRSVMDDTVGPIRHMSANPSPSDPPYDPTLPGPTLRDPTPGELHQPGEPDPDHPGIDGLSGGTFS
jgi:TatA/E family protein of Tat protein translocase